MKSFKVKDFVNVYENNKNKQVKFEIKKKALKDCKLDIKDILNTPLKNKLERFERG